MRPIDADVLENALLKVKDFAPELCGRPIIRVTDMINIIRKMPTADAAPIRLGLWKCGGGRSCADGSSVCDAWVCSECGKYNDTLTNFCPNCGADMREVKKNG